MQQLQRETLLREIDDIVLEAGRDGPHFLEGSLRRIRQAIDVALSGREGLPPYIAWSNLASSYKSGTRARLSLQSLERLYEICTSLSTGNEGRMQYDMHSFDEFMNGS